MPSQIYSVQDLKRLLGQGAQLVDVLDTDDYAFDHLPGAINIPLRTLDRTTSAQLDTARPVVVYCNDFG